METENNANAGKEHPFDMALRVQRAWKKDGHLYRLLILSESLTSTERRKLFFWYMKGGEFKDKTGKIRAKLINDVSDEDIVSILDKWMPENLREKLEKRLFSAPPAGWSEDEDYEEEEEEDNEN